MLLCEHLLRNLSTLKSDEVSHIWLIQEDSEHFNMLFF